MKDLVTFLRARLDEDEATARAACEYASASWRLDDDGETILWWPPKPSAADFERRHGLIVTADQWSGQTIDAGGPDIAPHIARWSPARVLAEIEAKRTELDLIGYALWLIRQLTIAKARQYADHPDFNPAWSDSNPWEGQRPKAED